MADGRRKSGKCAGNGDNQLERTGQYQGLFCVVMKVMIVTARLRDVGGPGSYGRLQAFRRNRHRHAANAYSQQNQPPHSHRIG